MIGYLHREAPIIQLPIPTIALPAARLVLDIYRIRVRRHFDHGASLFELSISPIAFPTESERGIDGMGVRWHITIVALPPRSVESRMRIRGWGGNAILRKCRL